MFENLGGNLLLKSRQNLLESDYYSVGASLGISSNSGKRIDGVNGGFNTADGYQSRAWVDQVSSIIGTNSVNINVDNNTNIVGAVIANKDQNGVDLGNLNLTTNSLTYSDLKNYNNSESSSFGINLSLGFKANDPTAPQNSESAQKNKGVIPGNLKLDLALNSQESSSDSKATIGSGNITVGGILNDETKLANLNRDINNSEQNKKTVITSDFESSLTLDTRLIAAAFYSASGAITGDKESSQKAVNNLGSYWGDVESGFSILVTSRETGLVGLSKRIKEETSSNNPDGTSNNDGHYPSLLPGLFLSESKTGKDLYQSSEDGLWREKMSEKENTKIDPLINGNGIKPTGLYYTDSQGKTVINQYDTNPALATLWHLIPGFKSFTQYHDYSVDHKVIPADQKTSSIPEYLLRNTVGAVGTVINPSFYQEVYRDLTTPQQSINNGANNE